MLQVVVLTAVLVNPGGLVAPTGTGAPLPAWSRAVALLEYVQSDFPNAVASGDVAELEEQQGLLDEVAKQLTGLDAAQAWVDEAHALSRLVTSRDANVSPRAGVLARTIVEARKLERFPRHVPDLKLGATVFAQRCVSCHGADGRAQTEIAATLKPRPVSFHDEHKMQSLTPARAFDRVTFGVPGTAMAPIPDLNEVERWAVAFYTFTLRQRPCEPAAEEGAFASLQVLANSTDAALATQGLDVACARRVLQQPTLASLDVAIAGLGEAVEHARRGEAGLARQAVVDAYLEGVEPVEPLLRARDPALVAELERGFTQARLAAQQGEGLEAQVPPLLATLARARAADHASGFWSVFFAAALILLREGFEAVVVVGALLAALKKLGATREAKVVHLGWMGALLFGAAAFWFGQKLFAGANREWLEALVALGAVGLLLYAALWLNSRTTMSRFMGELRAKMGDAVTRGSVTSLFVISFTSVGRESIETALFLQGLATDSRAGATWGALAGLVALLGLVAFIRRVGFALPMKTLFSASTFVLVATAVALLGKGLHGLQELGVLPLWPLGSLPSVDPLGLYPDVVTLGPQLLLGLAAYGWSRPRPSRAPAPGTNGATPVTPR